MNKVISLANYRSQKKKTYLSQHQARLAQFIDWFVRAHMDVNFLQMADDYQQTMFNNAEMAWDYMDFREILRDSLEEAFGAFLLAELKKEPWFDSRFISIEEILDRCLSDYILGQCRFASLPY